MSNQKIKQRKYQHYDWSIRRKIELKDEIPQPRYRKLHADDWQRFKRTFVETYGAEQVQDTGMTHSEFLKYFRDGTREGHDPKPNTLKAMLEELQRNRTP